ncbi:NAD dependent epimerase/dehydratase family protein [Neisseria meningitidis NM151]|nr:NAD dependent epimerase/dehydratase family protein [Neisseria meningitidis NM151]
MRAVPPPHISITGLGYLGLPLAQKFYQHGSRVAAIKRSLTSDDINLPIHLDTFDLGSTDAFQTALWRHHADKPVWFFLLPPSSLTHYADTVKQWAELARACNVQHLIFTSSTSVYGDTARECDETATPDPRQTSPPNNTCSTAASPTSTSCGWAGFIAPNAPP